MKRFISCMSKRSAGFGAAAATAAAAVCVYIVWDFTNKNHFIYPLDVWLRSVSGLCISEFSWRILEVLLLDYTGSGGWRAIVIEISACWWVDCVPNLSPIGQWLDHA